MDKKIIRQRLQQLRAAMRENQIDYYLIPTADFHHSEYVSAYFKEREFLSGFTGSNGTLVVSLEEAGLWTDGRYFVQAEKELADTGVRLYRMQEEGVPDIPEYLEQYMWEGQCLGFDGRCVDARFGKLLEQRLSAKKIRFQYEKDLIDTIWADRPAFPCSLAEAVPPQYCGCTIEEKVAAVREKMKEAGAACFFLSKLDDLMWLFNIRGNDVACNPVLMSYGFISQEDVCIFLQGGALQRETVEMLRAAGVQIRDYFKVLPFLQEYLFSREMGIGRQKSRNRGRLLYDERNTSYLLYKLFTSYGSCIEQADPTELLKAAKPEKELEYVRDIYLKDSVALTKFIYWVKKAVKEQDDLTEYSVSQYLESLRREIPEFLGLSFETISAYMANAAMAHYHTAEETSAVLKPEGFLLVDSGGQYLGGTTDVTRTIVLGALSDKMKEHFTAVAVGMLRLAGAKFLYGCSGRNLDILARSPLWEKGIDYKHGTGHGIGYMLSVHEGPQNIRWMYSEGMREAALEAGMIVSDEPGVYFKDEYGIRTENILEVRKGVKNGDGQFMEFAHLTYVPIDLDAILPEQMPQSERSALNEYHKTVYEKVSPFLNEEERIWLEEATKAI